MPATTFPPRPAAWSLIMFSHVAPARRPPPRVEAPKNRGLGRTYTLGTGTTNRTPSIDATSPPPQLCASGMDAW